MNLSQKELAEIFYSGTHAFKGDGSLIQKIHFLLQHNYLKCEKISVSTKSEFYNICDSIERNPNFDEAAGGGSMHVALKLIAQIYLEKQGMSAIFEKQFLGYFPDVITEDLQTIVECGHTDNVDKIFTYFIQGNVAEIIQLPYPTSDDPSIYGYRFLTGNNLREFLQTEFDIDKQDVLKIINRKNRA